MRVVKAIFILVSLTLCGCVTHGGVKPSVSNIQKSKVYDFAFERVWPQIIAIITESNFNITAVERESGMITVSKATYDELWANEGERGSVSGVRDQVVDRFASFNVYATRHGLDETRVRVISNYMMKIRTGKGSGAFPYRYGWHKAYSNGTLERMILEGVGRNLAEKKKKEKVEEAEKVPFYIE